MREQDFNLTRIEAMEAILSSLNYTDGYGNFRVPTPDLFDAIALAAHNAAYAVWKLDKPADQELMP